MKTLLAIFKRNVKLFFKDKGMFFTALITPGILLLLYATFLGNIYKDTFVSVFPQGFEVDESLINGCVGGQLISSILAVSCVTVAFCSNMLMVQDKANSTVNDFNVTPVSRSVMAVGYYVATLFSTLLICFVSTGICLGYVASVGFYMSLTDVLLLFLDVFLLVMFGTALSSIINFFLSTQGQISAVGSIISSVYGFICGAYMPISQFSDGLQKVMSFLPGTYGTSLVRNHAMRGVLSEMESQGVPSEMIQGIKDTIDCNVYFFGERVEEGTMYLILSATVVVLITVYVAMNVLQRKRSGK